MFADLSGYSLDDDRVGQHPGLQRVGADILNDRIDLRSHDVRTQLHDLRHTHGVLRRDRSDHRSSIHSNSSESFEIGLNPRAGSGVRAGDGKSFAH